MTATDELRRLLDERGVEWRKAPHYSGESQDNETIFEGNGIEWYTNDHMNGRLGLRALRYEVTPEQAIEATLGTRITGKTSDGYHTFDELYHHRAVLFSVVVRDHAELAWKSKLHHDGTMYDGMFIVGIETPQGQATYHYDIDPYWDMFDCQEFERAPEWDGHTPSEAIERISILGRETCEILGYDDGYDEGVDGEMYQYADPRYFLSCEHEAYGSVVPNYCPVCGRKVVDEWADQAMA